jgi:ribonuclease E
MEPGQHENHYMKRILINATQSEELRVAIVDGQRLYNLDIEVPSREQKKASIYKGVITRIEPSLEAAFVDYGGNRHGFLPFKEVAPRYFREDAKKAEGRIGIKEALSEGQELIVQIEKEERGNKGAALTTKISLPGRYMVLMPTEPRAGGVSRRIEGEDRTLIREAMDGVKQPSDVGTIVRTAGIGRSTEELQWDLDYLMTLWHAIEAAAAEKPAPFLIYHDGDLVVRVLRDHFSSDIGEILVDSEEMFKRGQEFMQQVMPNELRKLKLYQDRIPLFNRFQIESQIESAFQRTVSLPSGGAIVIDHTEALTSIDINSARATRGSDIEETALHTNLEAADEIARQLRLRDLGGLIVVDFIDMLSNKNQREVENRLRDAMHHDRARVQIGRISRFGLLEMSRQRLRPSLGDSSQEVCPRCSGHGTVRNVESTALSILRLIQEDALKEKTSQVIVHLPVDVATYLLNEKRKDIADIEQRYGVHVVLIPDSNYERPNYQLDRVRLDDRSHAIHSKSSYELPEKPQLEVAVGSQQRGPAEIAAVQSITPTAPAPTPPAPAPTKTEQPSSLLRFFKNLFAGGAEEKPKTPEVKKPQSKSRQQQGQRQDRNARGARQRPPRNANKDSGGQTAASKPAEAQQQSPQAKTDESKPTGEGRRRSRRRRPSRQRRDNDGNQTANQNRGASQSSATQDSQPKSAATEMPVKSESSTAVPAKQPLPAAQAPQPAPVPLPSETARPPKPASDDVA